MKRISFNEFGASHLYELALENFQPKCYECKQLKKRLEKFIDPKELRRIKRKVSFTTTTQAKKPVKIKFHTKGGEAVSFSANKIVTRPVKVKFYAKKKKD